MRKPGVVTAIGTLMLVSGIHNVVFSILITISLLAVYISFAAATYGIGLIALPLVVIPGIYCLVVGIIEIVKGSKYLSTPPKTKVPPTVTAVFGMISLVFGSSISFILELIAVILMHGEEAKEYVSEYGQ